MNKPQKLYDGITNIDAQFIEEAQTEEIRKRTPWKKWGALAACLCIVAFGAIAWAHPWTAGRGVDVPILGREPAPSALVSVAVAETNTPSEAPTQAPSEAPEVSNPFVPMFNEADGAPVGTAAMVSLSPEDSETMSAEECLEYFGVSLPEDGIVPGGGFVYSGGGCMGERHGVFQTEQRGVYFDNNTFRFTAGDKSITLTLCTAFPNTTPSPEQVKNGPEKIMCTEFKGWNLVLFRYENESGEECVYTEFVRDGVVCSVTACGLADSELAAALDSVLPPKDPVSEPRVDVGTVTHVDSRKEDYWDGTAHQYAERHDYITVDCGGIKLTVWLPGEADRFQEGDSVTVTYTGEPATAYNIWPGQIISVE